MATVYDAAGGLDGLLRLAEAWHARVMADEVVSHAFSHGFRPDHSERLAAYWADGPHEEMDRRAVACFDQALVDVGLDDRTRGALSNYFAWATSHEMGVHHESAEQVPDGLPLPRWSWDGLYQP